MVRHVVYHVLVNFTVIETIISNYNIEYKLFSGRETERAGLL